MTDKAFSAIRCIGAALRYIATNKRDLFMLATPPVIGLAIIETLIALALPEATLRAPLTSGTPSASVVLATFGVGLLNIVFYVLFAVAWHRKYLLDEAVTVAQALRWRAEKTRFLICLLLFSVVLIVVMFSGVALSSAMGQLAVIPGLLTAAVLIVITSRLSLIFPAAAIGKRDFGFKDAWRMGKGKTLGLFLILLIPSVLALVATIPFALLALAAVNIGVAETMTGYFLLTLFDLAVNYLAIALAVSSLSAAYEVLARGQSRPDVTA